MAAVGVKVLIGSALSGGGIFHFRKFVRDGLELIRSPPTSESPSLKTSVVQNFLRMYPLTHLGLRVLLSGITVRRVVPHWSLFFRQNLK